MRSAHRSRLVIGLATLTLLAGLSPFAQEQAPAPGAPQGGAPVAIGPQGGRGGGRGAGGPRGGADLTFRGPVLPLSAG